MALLFKTSMKRVRSRDRMPLKKLNAQKSIARMTRRSGHLKGKASRSEMPKAIAAPAPPIRKYVSFSPLS